MNPKVDFFFDKAKNWQAETVLLRIIILSNGLTEELKWGCPCYTYKNSNVVLIHSFKNYCALLFFKGALLKDGENLLIRQTENVQSARQIRFTDIKEVEEKESIIKAYVFEAVEIEKAGLKVELKKSSEHPISQEFQSELGKNELLKTAFEALTPGRQRAYNLYFSQPKQVKTRETRIKNCIPKIMGGKGLLD